MKTLGRCRYGFVRGALVAALLAPLFSCEMLEKKEVDLSFWAAVIWAVQNGVKAPQPVNECPNLEACPSAEEGGWTLNPGVPGSGKRGGAFKSQDAVAAGSCAWSASAACLEFQGALDVDLARQCLVAGGEFMMRSCADR